MGFTLTGRLLQLPDGTWVGRCVELGCAALGRSREEAVSRLRELVQYEFAAQQGEGEAAGDLVPLRVELPAEEREECEG